MAISSPGIGSNLDVNSIVSQLMAVERQPLTALDTKEISYQAKLTAYGNLKSALSSFQGSLSALNSASKFSALSTSVGDSTLLSASAASTASPSSHSVEVQTLAQAHTLRTDFTAANTTDVVGTGTLTFYFGTYDSGLNVFTNNASKGAQSITVDSSNNTLGGLKDAINNAKMGISASIINDGTTNRLMLTSAMGASNSLKIAVTDSDAANTDMAGLSQLAYDPTATKNMVETVAAVDSKIKVDGVTVSKSTNTISDAIQGVTLNLLKANVGTTTTVTVSRDASSISTAIGSFVKGYNDLAKQIKDLTAYDASTKKGGTLLGDSAVLTVQSRLRSLLNTAITSVDGGKTTLSSIGVSFQKDGTLAFDSSKLSTAMSKDPVAVAGLFTSIGKAEDSLISYVSAKSTTQVGSYGVDISQIATQGNTVGSDPANLTITAGSNDSLALTIDGVSTTVTLAEGTYATVADLISEVQSKINGASAFSSAGISATVTDDGLGVLTITSNRYGSASYVTLGGNAANDLLGLSPTITNGLDVAGTINGNAASGSGQYLTDTGGLKIQINGGATGNRGNVTFVQGYATQLDSLISDIIGSSGTIAGRTDGINSSIDNLNSRRELLSRRLSAIEKRYRNQFTNLDTLISSMNKTSTFLTQQLSALTKATSA